MPNNISVPRELKAYIPGFLERRDKDLAQLRDLIAQEDYQLLGTIGHKLKGNGASYGFPAITEIGGALEDAASKKDKDRIFGLVEDFAELIAEIKEHV